jgi:DinB superfamily
VSELLRYPIGKFHWPEAVSAEERLRYIEALACAPARLREAVAGLSDDQLDTPYREGGWTVRQVVHHLPDSHMNSFIRCKLALTEAEPTIKPYDEAAWAHLADVEATPNRDIAASARESARTLDCAARRHERSRLEEAIPPS